MTYEIQAISTGFARVVTAPGPDTLRLTIQRPEREVSCALSRAECAELATILNQYARTLEV